MPFSAAPPIVPASMPGNRAPSWPAGTVRSSLASAGEASYVPGSGSLEIPGGTGAFEPSGATSSRVIVCPW